MLSTSYLGMNLTALKRFGLWKLTKANVPVSTLQFWGKHIVLY